MFVPVRIAMLCCAAMAALALGACGSDDSTSTASADLGSDDYALQVQDITSAFAGAFGELSQDAANPASPEDFRDAVVAIQDRINVTVDDLDGLDPPAEVADLHDQLVTVFADYRDGYDPIVEALDADDKKALSRAAKEIPGFVEDFQTTYEGLKSQFADAGITIEVAGSEQTP